MISKMAMEDIEALRADGIDVPPREVVRLNALGLKVERSADSADVWVLPRVAFLGGSVLFEPTIGAEIWLRRAARAFGGDSETVAMLRILSMAVPWQDLPPPEDVHAIRDFMEDRLKAFHGVTFRQLENAIAYCIDGDIPEDGEEPPPKGDDGGASHELQGQQVCLAFGLLNEGLALGLGTAADLKDMTTSLLRALVDAAYLRAKEDRLGGASAQIKTDAIDKNKALGDYLRTRDVVMRGGVGKEVA